EAAGRLEGEIMARQRSPWGEPHGKGLSALRAYRKSMITLVIRKESCASRISHNPKLSTVQGEAEQRERWLCYQVRAVS
ncbi:MAG: hypothetical protein AAFV88_02395, partial [Planctomycetota bacterium]